jgi:hypothetical protein
MTYRGLLLDGLGFAFSTGQDEQPLDSTIRRLHRAQGAQIREPSGDARLAIQTHIEIRITIQ